MSYGSKTPKRRFARIVAPLVFVIAGPAALLQAAPATAARGLPLPATAATAAGSAAKAVYFHTLRPGAKLPSDAHCSRLVNASRQAEDKHANKPFNKRKGRHVGARFLAEDGTKGAEACPADRRQLHRHHDRHTAVGCLQVGHRPGHRLRPGGSRELVAAGHPRRLGHRRRPSACPDTSSARTASRASARRATASCRTAIPTSPAAGRPSPSPPR